MRMTEFQREQILEERSGERQKIQNAKMLADLVRQQQRGGSGAAADESVARAAKRAFLRPMRICNRGIYPIFLRKRPAYGARGYEREGS